MPDAYRIGSSSAGHRPFTLTNIRHWSWGEWGRHSRCRRILHDPDDDRCAVRQRKAATASPIPHSRHCRLDHVRGQSLEDQAFPADIEGVVHFAEPQFRIYLARLDDPKVWQPVPLLHGGTKFDGSYAPDCFGLERYSGCTRCKSRVVRKSVRATGTERPRRTRIVFLFSERTEAASAQGPSAGRGLWYAQRRIVEGGVRQRTARLRYPNAAHADQADATMMTARVRQAHAILRPGTVSGSGAETRPSRIPALHSSPAGCGHPTHLESAAP